jgi:hypothetical protein
MSKRSGVPNGVEKAAKEVVQQPSKYTNDEVRDLRLANND